jgi:hypothetical protein
LFKFTITFADDCANNNKGKLNMAEEHHNFDIPVCNNCGPIFSESEIANYVKRKEEGEKFIK